MHRICEYSVQYCELKCEAGSAEAGWTTSLDV